MSAWAKPGVKVVCVDAFHGLSPTGLVEGRIYEILDVDSQHVGVAADGSIVVAPSISLVGVVKPPPFNLSNFYSLGRFRPLITRTQSDDVRLIKSLLLEDAGLVPAGVELDA